MPNPKSHIICFLICIFVPYYNFSQEFVDFESLAKPRNKPNADSIGFYKLAYQIESNVLDPGDTLKVNLFFTGYGQIKNSKIYFLPSKHIFDTSSITTHSLGGYPNYPRWGDSTNAFNDYYTSTGPFDLTFNGGMTKREWKDTTPYVDYNNNPHSLDILTEQILDKPPITYLLKTKRNIRPGQYFINIYFTYFNGSTWQGDNVVIPYTITTWIQRNEDWAWWFGIGAAGFSIIASMYQFWRWIKKKVTKTP